MFFNTHGDREREHLTCKDAVKKTNVAVLWENMF